LPNPTC
jgi:hypothetical protein